MRRVVIATPTRDGRVDAKFAFSVFITLPQTIAANIDLRLYMPVGKGIEDARNDCVAAAIHGEFDDLVFIDDDQAWNPGDFMRLLSHGVDCVAGPVRKKGDGDDRWNVRVAGGAPNLVEVPGHAGLLTSPDMAVGTGFMRLTRRAMRALWDNSEAYRFSPDSEENRWIFDTYPQDGFMVGEDFHACNRLRELGIASYLDPFILVGHSGRKEWVGDFPSWVRRSRAFLNAPPLPLLEPLPGQQAAAPPEPAMPSKITRMVPRGRPQPGPGQPIGHDRAPLGAE